MESEEARVEVFSRLLDGRWAQSVFLPGHVACIPSLGIELSLDELYENALLKDGPSPNEAPSPL